MPWWRKPTKQDDVVEIAAIAMAFQIAFGQLALRHFFQRSIEAGTGASARAEVEAAKQEVEFLFHLCVSEAERKLGIGVSSARVTEVLSDTMLKVKRELDEYARTGR